MTNVLDPGSLQLVSAEATGFLLPDYRVHRYALQIEALERLRFPRDRAGVILRGAFGLAFRRLVCHDLHADCRRCLVVLSCPYARVFAPSPPAGAARLRLQADIPRPFVFAPDLDAPEDVLPGAERTIGLVLIGDAVEFLPYFVVAFRALGEQGIGPGRGRFRLRSVRTVGGRSPEPVFRHGESVVRNLVRPETPGAQPPPGPVERLTLRFVTPTTLRAGAEAVAVPEFHHVIKRLRDRVSATHYFYCGGPWEVDHRALGALSEKVVRMAEQTGWVGRLRRSARTGRTHPLSGFVGEVTFGGNLTPFVPLLRVGELVHVGKAATFGNGRFQVISGQSG